MKSIDRLRAAIRSGRGLATLKDAKRRGKFIVPFVRADRLAALGEGDIMGNLAEFGGTCSLLAPVVPIFLLAYTLLRIKP